MFGPREWGKVINKLMKIWKNAFESAKKKKKKIPGEDDRQMDLKATLLAAVGGCLLNNNQHYTSKTFPHPLTIFYPSFYLLSQPHSTSRRLEDIISLLAPVI